MLFFPQANLASEKSLTLQNCSAWYTSIQNHLLTDLAREAANPKDAARRP